MKLRAKTIGVLFCFIVTLTVSGCFSPVRYGANLQSEVPQEMHYADLTLSGEVLDRWWEAYGDEQLNAFIENVLRENMSLQSSYLRVLDMRMASEQSKSGYYPNLNLSAGVSGGGALYTDPSADPNYSLGLSLGYEIDLWGKLRAQSVVNDASYYNAQDAAESAAITLVSNVVTQWFNVQYYNDKKALTEELLKLSESYYELVQEYYRSGQSTGMDVLEQNNQLENLRSTIKTLETNARIAERALEILAGGKIKVHVEGSLPTPIDVGGTVDVQTLMERRPDIRSALRSAQASDAKIVIALAERLPSLRLSFSLSYRNGDITELFKRLMWDLAGNFVANLFDGFKSSKAIDRAKLTFLQDKTAYGIVVLEAVQEVEKALLMLNLRNQDLADAQAELARQTNILEVSRDYYIGGMIDYNRVLSALRSMISNSQSELEARKNLLTAQIDLFKAMGGGSWLENVTEQNTKAAEKMLEQLNSNDDDNENNSKNDK